MKILFYTGGGVAAPYIINSSCKALRNLGHEIRSIEIFRMKEEVSSWLSDFRPDIVIALDHTGINDDDFIKHGIFYCSWFVDQPLYFVESSQFNERHIALVSDRSFEYPLKKMGCSHIVHCPLAFDKSIFCPEENAPSGASGADIAYVGSFPGLEQTLQEKRRKKFKPVINDIVDSCRELIRSDPSLSIWQAVHKLDEISGRSFLSVMNDESIGGIMRIIDTEMDASNKQTLFDTFRSYSFRIYGDEGWKDLAQDSGVYRGKINYEKELPGLYRRTKINIVLTRPQIASGVNQRIFDIPAVKGFMLCDFRNELKEIFPDSWELISCRNFNEFREKADYYLTHEKERQEIALDLFNAVRNRHTYEERMKQVIEKIGSIVAGE